MFVAIASCHKFLSRFVSFLDPALNLWTFFQDDIDIKSSGDSSEETSGGSKDQGSKKEAQDPKQSLQLLLQRQSKFLETCREVKVNISVGQILRLKFLLRLHSPFYTWWYIFKTIWQHPHLAPQVKLWRELNCRFTSAANVKFKEVFEFNLTWHSLEIFNGYLVDQGLAGELGPFVCSGSHVIQKDCHLSAVHTFMEATCQCVRSIPFRPRVIKVGGLSAFISLDKCE